MTRQFSLVAVCGAMAFAFFGCSDDSGSRPTDSGVVIMLDAGPGRDSGTRPDAQRPDTGAGACNSGGACIEDLDCPLSGSACLTETATTIGQAGDLVYGVPGTDGGTMVPVVQFEGGACTELLLDETTSGACDPDNDTGCEDCSSCVSLGRTTGGTRIVACINKCVPSTSANSCRDGYSCDLGAHICYPGCSNDTECRIYRRDGNGNGEFDDAATDPLTYDPLSMATCNQTTGRCEQPSGGGVAGDTCERDAQCEANGLCFTEIDRGFEDGMCTKFGCELAGNGCAGEDSSCWDIGGASICLKDCVIGAEPEADQLGVDGHGAGCRTGWYCVGDSLGNAGCLPGNYNAVETNNVGGDCEGETADEQCYSPFGRGRCLEADGWFASGPQPQDGYCTINCTDEALPDNICGDNAVCTQFGETGLCIEKCTTAADCGAGYGCIELFTGNTQKFCFPACTVDADCGTGFRCQTVSGEDKRCVPTT